MKIKIFYCVIVIYLVILYFYYINDSIICGMDRLFMISAENEYKNYPIIEYRFGGKQVNLYERIVNLFKNDIKNRKSKFRLRLINNYMYGYSEESVEEVINYTFVKVEDIKKIDKHQMVLRTIKNPNKILYYVDHNNVLICHSHLFHSGIGVLKIMENGVLNLERLVKLPNYKYIPIYNELITGYNLLKILYYGLPKKNLSLDYPRDKTDMYKSTKFKISINFIKFFKRRIKKKYNLKINFSTVFCSILALFIFLSTSKTTFSLGILYSFNNRNKFNDFAPIIIDVNKPKNITNLTIFNIEKYIIEIDRKIKQKKFMIPLSYSLINIYNINFRTTNYIDLLISTIPVRLLDKDDIVKVSMPYHTCPLWCFYLSSKDFISTTLSSRTDDVNIINVKKLYNYFSKI